MRVEVLPRLWIADRKHSKCTSMHSIKVHKLGLENQTPHMIVEQLLEKTKKIYTKTMHLLESVVLIDRNIHDTYVAYLMVVAYLIRYSGLSIQNAKANLGTKTLTFRLSSTQIQCLREFKRRCRGKL